MTGAVVGVHFDPPLRLGVHPATQEAAGGENERVRAVVANHSVSMASEGARGAEG